MYVTYFTDDGEEYFTMYGFSIWETLNGCSESELFVGTLEELLA